MFSLPYQLQAGSDPLNPCNTINFVFGLGPSLPVGESVVEAILALVRSARPGPEGGDAAKLIAWGPGPRASQALMLAVRARALLERRFAPSVDDVIDLATPILKHRMALTFAARADGETIDGVVGRLKTRIG